MTVLTRIADEYLVDHSKIAGVMVETPTFPGFASVGVFADYARFIANHHAHVRRLAPVAESMANHVVGVEMRHYPFAERTAAKAWLRSS